MTNKKNKGITLIALIVSIIVILILVGTGITFLVGENVILVKSKDAKDSTQKASEEEENKLAQINDILNNNVKEIKSEYSSYQTTEVNGEVWVKIFEQDISKSHFKESEMLDCNTDGKYSILNQLEKFRNVDGTFEFKIEYPELNKYNRWKQTSNPVKTYETVSGYQPIQIYSSLNSWKGLCRSNSTANCFIDGSVGVQQWYYAIGVYSDWKDLNGKMGIPSDSAAVNKVMLWVRVDNLVKSNINYITQEKDGATWIKLLYQNNNNGTVLFNSNEVNFCDKQGKYSILGEIEKYRDNSGNFEFMLEYPEINQYNRWTQSSNPTEYVEVVNDYEAIQTTWKTQNWGGLARSNSSACYIDGSVGVSSWFYAIGSYINWTDSNNRIGIPSYNSNLAVNEVNLWVRIDNLNGLNNGKIKTAYSAQWKQIFYHNILKSGNIYFNTSNELNCDEKFRYSKLVELDNYRGSDGKFEFLMELPDYDGYNRWKQTSNPVNTLESITGYSPINISFSTNGWNGLAKSNSSACLLDGNVGSGNWFYGISQYAAWYGGIPANLSGTGINSLKLWVRIDNK